ncbi:uncharacterized protein LOC143738157 [Siphateles boraxobius]|uniref:uncharacterized protein LOC143738157 n=1 Tax=Siphateles boraxobius TaxID=180520 RepID=UPI0040642740
MDDDPILVVIEDECFCLSSDEISVKKGEDLKLDVVLINADKVERNSRSGWTEVWRRGHGVSSDRLIISDQTLIIHDFTVTDTGTYRVLDSNNEALITVTVTESVLDSKGNLNDTDKDKTDDTEHRHANTGNRVRGGRGGGRTRTVISDEMRHTVVHHVVSYGEAGQRVRANLSRSERLPTQGCRERVLSPEQETEIINMVLENYPITLRQIQRKIIENNEIFQNIDRVSLSTLDRVLRRNHLRMKVCREPFQRNSERVKELRYNYVQRVLELEVSAVEHQFIFIDEVGINLTNRRKRGRNIVGQRGGNITMCAAITRHGVLHQHATLGRYNTARLMAFLDSLHNTLIPPDQIAGPERIRYAVVWDDVSLHRAALVRHWFTALPRFLVVYLPPYSPFLNPIEGFFSAWRWKVYDRNPQTRISLLHAMEDACGDIAADAFDGWDRHARQYFRRCLARENIACDVDEVLWPDQNRREDAA